MKSLLIINSTDINGNKKQKAITNINPSATSAQLKEFAQRFTALSTNSYDSANVVDTFNVDAEQRISGGGVSTIEVTVPVEVTIPVEVTVPGETVTIAGDTVTVTIAGDPVTVTVEGEPATVTVEAEPVTVTVEAEPTTVTVQADPKTNPTFSLGEWAGSNNTYSAVVSYNGDGVLTANTGTLSGSTITVSDEDGNFSGVISAAEGTNFAPSNLAFNHTKETVGGSGGSGISMPNYTLNEVETAAVYANQEDYELIATYASNMGLEHELIDYITTQSIIISSKQESSFFNNAMGNARTIATEQGGELLISCGIDTAILSDYTILCLRMHPVFLAYLKANNVLPKAMYAYINGGTYVLDNTGFFGVIVGNEFQKLTTSNLASATELYACCLWQDILEEEEYSPGGPLRATADLLMLFGLA